MVIYHRPQPIYVSPTWDSGVGDFTGALIQALSPASLDNARQAANKGNDAVQKGYDVINEALKLNRDVGDKMQEVFATFGPPADAYGFPNVETWIALEPLTEASSGLASFDKRIAAMDVLFLHLGGSLGSLGLAMQQAGLSTEGGNLRQVASSMDNFRTGLRYDPPNGTGYYNARPDAKVESQRLSVAVRDALGAANLRYPTNVDAPEYWQVIMSVLGQNLGVETSQGLQEAAAAGLGSGLGFSEISGMGEPVSIALAIVGLLKIALIVVAIVAALYTVATVVKNAYHASNAASDAALEYQKRKTIREQEVAAGTKTQAQAEEENKADSEDTKATVNQIVDAAKNAGPRSLFKDLALPVGIGAAALVLVTVVGPMLKK